MTGMLSQSDLERLVAAGDIDTVIVAFCDMQGRLTGKRVSARLFVEEGATVVISDVDVTAGTRLAAEIGAGAQ